MVPGSPECSVRVTSTVVLYCRRRVDRYIDMLSLLDSTSKLACVRSSQHSTVVQHTIAVGRCLEVVDCLSVAALLYFIM